MARVALAAQVISVAGLTPAYTAVVDTGYSVPNDGKTFLHIKNGGGSALTVTLVTPASYKGVALADPTVSIAAGSERMIGPFDREAFNQSDGTVQVDLSAFTSVTAGAIRLG